MNKTMTNQNNQSEMNTFENYPEALRQLIHIKKFYFKKNE